MVTLNDLKKTNIFNTLYWETSQRRGIFAVALNPIYTPIIKKQIPKVIDFFLSIEALRYKFAMISTDKAYLGQVKKGAITFWSALP